MLRESRILLVLSSVTIDSSPTKDDYYKNRTNRLNQDIMYHK